LTRPELVVIGASTGGPPVLETILRGLPHPASVPIVIAQHILVGFETGLATWLTRTTGHEVVLARGGESPTAGVVYLAPADQDLRCDATLGLRPRSSHISPSVDVLFRSAAESRQARVVAILLSGMGRDGADGMLAAFKLGAMTITQDSGSCVVDSMPRNARLLGASRLTLPPEEIAPTVTSLLTTTPARGGR
jgi:two-component system chemotaxis response regulator CheB